MGRKVFLGSFVGIVLVAAAVATVIAVVKNNDNRGSKDGNGGPLHTSIKSVSSLCNGVAYPDACLRTLGEVSSSSNSTNVIRTAIKATLNEIKAALNESDNISKAVSDPNNQLAMQDCRELFEYAIDELKAVFHEADKLSSRSADLRSWTSAVITYQETCLDGLTLPELKDQVQQVLRNASSLTSNAMTLVTVLTDLAENISPDTLKDTIDSLSDTRRGLLGEEEDDYPKWMSANDRKLLGSNNNRGLKPDIVVAQDGSGDVKTINEAVSRVPLKNKRRFTIYVKAGIYKETVLVKAQNVFMYGDGPRKTRVTGNKHFPVPTMQTATFAVTGIGFLCKSMGFFNTAGPEGHQAVALRVQSDMSAFFNCRMDGYQDTLYTHAHRQFYRNCLIAGTIDFIFGDASAILQGCRIVIRRPMAKQFNTITAHGRVQKDQPTGLVLQNCKIVPEKVLMPDRLTIPTYYGRPWKAYSRTIIMESMVGDVVRPEGWRMWDGSNNHETCYYAEYRNQGPGAVTANRVSWAKKEIDKKEAMRYTVGQFISGNTWLASTGGRFGIGLTM